MKNWINELTTIMATLRSSQGCPWDREQTHTTLKPYLIEETFELIDAIDMGDDCLLVEELGDVLLQVVFHCQLAQEENRFDLQSVAQCCCEKLIRRHPHVYGQSQVKNTTEVLKQWEEIKQGEKNTLNQPSLLDGIPKSLPVLIRSEIIQKKAAQVGFDWKTDKDIINKIEEELLEVKAALTSENDIEIQEEIGDLLFAVVNLARFREISAEESIRNSLQKFVKRFKHIESQIQAAGNNFSDYSISDLERLWQNAKVNTI